MTEPFLYGLSGAALVGIGFYGLFARAHLLRRVLGLNILGSGIFLLFGSVTVRSPPLAVDPVSQAMIITGVVVALASSALAVMLTARLHEQTGTPYLPDEANQRDDGDRQ